MDWLSAPLIALQIAVAAPTPPVPGAAVPVHADAAFAELSRMVGVWRPADMPDSPLRLRFALTAGGTVLVEEWTARGKPHSLTLYHRDGARLFATHYCPQGNQPRLVLTGRDEGGLRFSFLDATDLDPATETHQHDLWIDRSDPVHPVRSEIYVGKGGPGKIERLRLIVTK